jgi:predicted nucleotidyltransferase
MTPSSTMIKLITDYFRTKPVTAVYLFGSYARGDADSQSDVDLVLEIDFDASTPINISRYKRELGALLLVHTDIYQHHTLLRYVRESISKERILIYQRN